MIVGITVVRNNIKHIMFIFDSLGPKTFGGDFLWEGIVEQVST